MVGVEENSIASAHRLSIKNSYFLKADIVLTKINVLWMFESRAFHDAGTVSICLAFCWVCEMCRSKGRRLKDIAPFFSVFDSEEYYST